MGVTGLWTVVHPCARPIKLETLNKRRLAIDASIWIYQFLKAVRDKDGNQLRNSHVVGFFRRICKLLFVGIKPVFVFDGGAPSLKRQTITGRKQRREGRREDAARTAGRLLALQIQRLAEEASHRNHAPDPVGEEEPLPENIVYVDEIAMSSAERQKNRHFRKKDTYHLPDLETPMAEMVQSNDPRVMSLEELQQYADQFNSGEDINVYDFSKIDYDSSFFQSLPPSDQYNILNAARLRSRLRMGLSKVQLDTMFPNRMAFSRFQIERVQERNMLTQRLMRLQGMSVDGTLTVDRTARVAGEKGREYVLVRNDGVEGGWALGVVATTGGIDKPIDIDALDQVNNLDETDDEDDEDFEDVPIQGLNRLPKMPTQLVNAAKQFMSINSERQRNFYRSRNRGNYRPRPKSRTAVPTQSLFVEESDDQDENEYVEPADLPQDDLNLQRAIAMSLEQDDESENSDSKLSKDHIKIRSQKKAPDVVPFTSNSGVNIARIANAKATNTVKRKMRVFANDSDDSDDSSGELNPGLPISKASVKPLETDKNPDPIPLPKPTKFDGPLPFEKIDLGQSLFSHRKKKAGPQEPTNPGGFILQDDENSDETKKVQPLPPWFAGSLPNHTLHDIAEDDAKTLAHHTVDNFEFDSLPTSEKPQTIQVLDLSTDEDDKEIQVSTVMCDCPAPSVDLSAEPNVLDEPRPRHLASQLGTTAYTDIPQNESRTLRAPATQYHDDDEDEVDDWEQVDLTTQSKDWQPVQSDAKNSIRTKSPSPIAAMQQASSHEDEAEKDDTGAKTTAWKEGEFDYTDPEEEELFRRIAQEEEEHLRFASSLNKRSLADNVAIYEEELKVLRKQHKSDLRDADEVTQTMISECQQLLSLFGLPYITAPMEAEAQCAELLRLGLVDGIVTDDSDIFLFGGNRVYKNMFNQAKLVECYLTIDLEREFGLTRNKLIAVAHLLGSDYTEGLPGVGPVTALEILTEFGTLENFKSWWVAVQNGTRSKEEDAMNVTAKKLRRNVTKTVLPTSFPDSRVDEAYLYPSVDSDPSDFVWGVPDLAALREFLSRTIGWSSGRTDEILVPVIRDMNRREAEGTQSNITAFFDGGVGAGAFAPRRKAGDSSRLQSALQKLGEQSGGISKPDASTTTTITLAGRSRKPLESEDSSPHAEGERQTKRRRHMKSN